MTSTMNDQDWQLLSAYLDDELSPEARADCAQRLQQEPALTAGLQALEALQTELRGTLHSAAAAQPVPPHIKALLDTAPVSITSLPHRLHNFTGARARGFAVAASLAAAAALLLLPQWQGSPNGPQHDTTNLLSATLEQLPSSADRWETLADGSEVRAILSFPIHDGTWCREYLLRSSEQSVRGIACRDNGQWETRVAVAQLMLPAGEEDAYRPASASDSDQIAAFVGINARDDVAGEEREAGLITSNWQ